MGKIDEVLQNIGDGDIKELLTEFSQEVAAEQVKQLKEQGWTAPPQVDEARLNELNARSDELRKARPTAEVMAERRKVREEIGEIVDTSGVTYTVDRR